jgi:peptidylprolyl isomerase
VAKKGKGARQQAVRRARIAAAEHAARRRGRRRRWIVVGLLAAIIVSLVLGATVVTSSGKSKSAAASGPPCVAMTDDPPVGAPYVPIHPGPPPTQLVSQELRVGTGPAVQPGDTVTVDYVGVACSTGKIFDETYSTGQPFQTPLSNTIPGWQQGIPGMQVGGQRLLGIPPSLAYGSNPPPGSNIAPNETLWFAIELKSIDASGSGSPTTAPGAAPAPSTPALTPSTPAAPPVSS